MSEELRFSHPRQADETFRSRNFIVYGTPPTCIHALEAELLGLPDDADTEIKVLQLKPIWAVAFVDVPDGKEYKVRLKWGPKKKHTKDSEKFDVNTSEGHYRITITYPASNANVCNNFIAYGTSDDVYDITGYLHKFGSPDIIGTTLLQPGTSGLWSVQFTAVPTGTYILYIADSHGHHEQSNNVNVGPAFC
jgi:hypothetical protein